MIPFTRLSIAGSDAPPPEIPVRRSALLPASQLNLSWRRVACVLLSLPFASVAAVCLIAGGALNLAAIFTELRILRPLRKLLCA